jgi:hypothetical protein
MLGTGMPVQTLLQKVDRESPALFALACMMSYSSGPRYTVIRFFFDGIFASGVERFTANKPLTPGGQDAR